MLSCQKNLFNLSEELIYLNCAYMSPFLKTVEEAGIEGIRKRRNPALSITPQDFFTHSDRLKSLFSKLVNIPDFQRVALQPAVSYGMAIVAKNLDCKAGQNIIVADEQFPSNVYAWRNLATQKKLKINTIKPNNNSLERGKDWNTRILEAINQDTTLVALPHFHWADGTRFDLKAVRQRASEVGALLVIDGTQSVGAYPFDIQEIKPDALVCSAYKWLFCSYTTCLSYFGEYFDGKLPLEETWLARKDSVYFNKLVEYQDDYEPLAIRYDMGGRANPALLAMGIAALEQILAWGTADIQGYLKNLTAPLFEILPELGYIVEQEEYRSPHLFGIRLPKHIEMDTVKASFAKHHISVSFRGTAIRVAPHVYNDENEIATMIKALKEI
jgi:selenocysteine lyase/cysteine desulfurase